MENGQHDHFNQLLRTLVCLGHDWAADWSIDEFHIKFGRIEGMSTRRGNVVFLRDVLDELKHCTLDRMNATDSQYSVAVLIIGNATVVALFAPCTIYTDFNICSTVLYLHHSIHS